MFLILLIPILVALFLALSAAIFGWAWNTAAPLFWIAAPHLTFWTSLATVVLFNYISGTIRGVSGLAFDALSSDKKSKR